MRRWRSWRRLPLMALPLLLQVAPGTAWAATGPVTHGSPPGGPAPHDLHMAYGDLAIEGRVIAGRIRIFKDDLERALGPLVGADALSLTPGSEADALVMRYLRDHLEIEVDGELLRATLVDSGQDELDRETVWWLVVQYEAPAPPESFTVRNTLLFELFDDQRNVFKFVRFPEQVQQTYTFTPGEAEHRVRLQSHSPLPHGAPGLRRGRARN